MSLNWMLIWNQRNVYTSLSINLNRDTLLGFIYGDELIRKHSIKSRRKTTWSLVFIDALPKHKSVWMGSLMWKESQNKNRSIFISDEEEKEAAALDWIFSFHIIIHNQKLSTWVRQICSLVPGAYDLSEMHWQAERTNPCTVLCPTLKLIIKEALLTPHWTQCEKDETLHKQVLISATPALHSPCKSRHLAAAAFSNFHLAKQLGDTPPTPSSLLQPIRKQYWMWPSEAWTQQKICESRIAKKMTLWQSSQSPNANLTELAQSVLLQLAFLMTSSPQRLQGCLGISD